MFRIASFLLILVLLPLTGCSSSDNSAPVPGEIIDAEKVIEQDITQIYTLDSGDRIRVSVFDEDDISGQFEIDSEGYISMPLIGRVYVKGLTLLQAKDVIVERLLDGYLKNPRVALEILNYRPFYVLGEVKKPGSYPFVNGMSLHNAIALAGGFTYRASKNGILIKRGDKIIRASGEEELVIPIVPGDIIEVDERLF